MSQISLGRIPTFSTLSSLVALFIGCETAGVGKIQVYDPASAAAKAIETYDHNGDAKLSADEINSSPALAASGRRIDRNGDGIVTADEIQARMEEIDAQSDYIGLDVVMTYKDRPLVGAELTLTPEAFMGEDYPRFTGTTVEGGGCPLMNEGKRLPGMPPGFYQAKIVHSAHGLDVVRGVEIADDTTGSRLEIAL